MKDKTPAIGIAKSGATDELRVKYFIPAINPDPDKSPALATNVSTITVDFVRLF